MIIYFCRCMEAGLKYRYHEQWGPILQVIGVLFEVTHIHTAHGISEQSVP
jgi:hypothetical protein